MKYPLKQRLFEMMRPAVNLASVSHPWSRPVLSSAAHVLATTEESARVIRWGGVQSVSTCFPDAVPQVDPQRVMEERKKQQEELRDHLSLIFSGRALWWKGGHLALEVLKEARKRDLPVSLRMITQGEAEPAWKDLARKMRLDEAVTWSAFVPREQVLEEFRKAHVFVYPTLHDSSSSALPEAYSVGLPSMTLGIGGAGAASSPEVGFNEARPTSQEWVSAVVDQLEAWHRAPEAWVACSRRAVQHAQQFGQAAIDEAVERELVPVFT